MMMKNEPVPDTTVPEPSDHVQGAPEDARAPDREDPTRRRADPLALDPYSPIEPTWAYWPVFDRSDVTDPAAVRSC